MAFLSETGVDQALPGQLRGLSHGVASDDSALARESHVVAVLQKRLIPPEEEIGEAS